VSQESLNAASPICWTVASCLEAIGRTSRGGGGRGADRRRGLLGLQFCPAHSCSDDWIWRSDCHRITDRIADRTADRITDRIADRIALDNADRRGFLGVRLDGYVAADSASRDYRCDAAGCDSARGHPDSARGHPDAGPNLAAEVRRACSGGLLLPMVP
jgi:hypothetical protein